LRTSPNVEIPTFKHNEIKGLGFVFSRVKRYCNAMPLFLASLRQPTQVYDVENVIEGFVLQPKTHAQTAFDDIVRRALNHAGDDFAVFPTSNGVGGYESVLIVPIAC